MTSTHAPFSRHESRLVDLQCMRVCPLSAFLSQITHDTDDTECVIYIPGWWLQVEMAVHTSWLVSHMILFEFQWVQYVQTQTNWYVPYCVVSPPDVETVEARRAALREAGGGLSSGRSTRPPTNSGPDGPQHFMAPWSPTAEPRPAYLPHDSRGSSCVRLLRLDRTHPHMPPGNCFHTE